MEINEIKLKVFQYYSNSEIPKCKYCGFNNINALCLDHINSDGNIHRKEKNKKGINLYKQLLKNNFKCDFKLQVLCANCNMLKFFDKKESKHIKTKEWREKISIAHKKLKKATGKNASRITKVNQFDLDGNFIKTWDYIKEADLFYSNNVNAKNISACCSNRQQTAYGYIWKYYKKEE